MENAASLVSKHCAKGEPFPLLNHLVTGFLIYSVTCTVAVGILQEILLDQDPPQPQSQLSCGSMPHQVNVKLLSLASI